MSKVENIVRTEESIMELPITVPSLETIRKTGDSILMLGLQEMGKILLGQVELPEESKKSVSELKIAAFNAIVSANRYVSYRDSQEGGVPDIVDDID